MEAVIKDTSASRISGRELEIAVAAVLKRLAARQGLLLSTAKFIGLGDSDAKSSQKKTIKRLIESIPGDLIESIELSIEINIEDVAPALIHSLDRAAKIAAADGMTLEDTMLAMERLIRSNRVELFSKGLDGQ